MTPSLQHRPDDEHKNVPTWRLRQLQDIEHAARALLAAYDAGEVDDETEVEALREALER